MNSQPAGNVLLVWTSVGIRSLSVNFSKRLVSVTEVMITEVAHVLRPIALNGRLKWPIHLYDRPLNDRKCGFNIFGYWIYGDRIFDNRIYFSNLDRSEKRLVKFYRVLPVRKDRAKYLSVALGHYCLFKD